MRTPRYYYYYYYYYYCTIVHLHTNTTNSTRKPRHLQIGGGGGAWSVTCCLSPAEDPPGDVVENDEAGLRAGSTIPVDTRIDYNIVGSVLRVGGGQVRPLGPHTLPRLLEGGGDR